MWWFSKPSKDEALVRSALARGVERVYPSPEFLGNLLRSGKRLTLYLGIDPTGPSLHLGHAIVLRKLREFQKLGHQVVLLIGDFTATIGDPTGKLAARPALTRGEVLANAKRYRAQASALLSFSGRNRARMAHNASWHARMTLSDAIALMSRVTVEQMAKRDMFVERERAGKPVFLHEFLYPLLQGYDSVAMNVDGEVGGNDQTFNMLVGRDLVKSMQGREKFVIAMKLLTDASGTKMGKTEGNMVSLADSPKDMFGKVMSWTDGMIIPGFELCTDVHEDEVAQIGRALTEGSMNPRDAKARLAREIVAVYHGEARARSAEENFGAAGDAAKVSARAGTHLAEVFLAHGVVASKSEWKRLVSSGAIEDAVSGEKVRDSDFRVQVSGSFRVGKKRFVHIVVGA